MTRAVLLKVVAVLAVSFAIVSIPESSFAQRGGGGHGGGGGFHGGGGGFHGGGFGGGGFHGGGGGGFHGGFGGGSGFHGGGFGGGGFHGGGFGGGFNGFHGGYDGFHHGFGGFGGGWGYPGWGWGGWGWGWGLDIGFGWPYWDWGYPNYYDYGPYAYGYPYYPYDPNYYPNYPNYAPDPRYDYRYAPGNSAPRNTEPDYRHDNSTPNNQTAPAKPSNMAVPEDPRGQNHLTRNYGATTGVSGTRNTPTTAATNFQLASSVSRTPYGPPLRPEVQNAIRLLRAMPPAARQEWLNSGRYANFSSEERQLLTTATQSPQLN